MAGAWVSSYCLNTKGFPKILYATLQKLRVKDGPEYEGREYEKHGTEWCEVTIYIGKSEEFHNIIEAWNVTANGFCFVDTYQLWPAKPCGTFVRSIKSPLLVPP